MQVTGKGLLWAAISLWASGPALADAPVDTTSLCETGETIVFSCSTGGKLVSLCEAVSPGNSEARLSYRFGRPGHVPELRYPANANDAGSGFQAASVPLSGGGGSWVEFTRSRYRYVVFSFWIQGEGEASGVAVERSGRRIATLSCQGPTVSRLGPDYFSSLRLPTAKPDFLP